MDRSSRLTVLAAVLTLVLSSCCHAENTVFYRPLRVYANEEVALPCWELIDASHLIIWITPAEVVIGPDYHDVSGKYTIDLEGSLVVNVTFEHLSSFRNLILKYKIFLKRTRKKTILEFTNAFLDHLMDLTPRRKPSWK